MSRKLHRHPFRFKIGDEVLEHYCPVKDAQEHVELVLTPEDVQRSMQLHGVANTQNCSMAVCAKRQADAFAHPVEGYIDWQYSRAYVVSKVKNGLPSECFVYVHKSDIAKQNDTAGGQRKLLEDLKRNGPKIIRLNPIGQKKRRKQKAAAAAVADRPAGRKTGERSSSVGLRGAAARYAYAKIHGGV